MAYRAQEIRTDVRVTKFVLVESKRYKEMYVRPYEMHVDNEALSKVERMVSNSFKREIGRSDIRSSSSISGYVNNELSNILTPSATVIDKANIENGWGEKRLKFVLIVEIKRQGDHNSVINYIQGYSEYLGVSKSDNLDPDMMLYANSVIKLVKTYNPHTRDFDIRPVDSFNVVFDETNKVGDAFNSLKLARPSDVAINVSDLKDMGDDVVSMSTVGSVNSPELADKRALLPTDHLTRTLKTTMDSAIQNNFIGTSNDTIETIVGNLSDPVLENIDFFKKILNIRNQDAGFTVNDLLFVDPNVGDVTMVSVGNLLSNTTNIPSELLTEDTAETHGTNLEVRLSLLVHEAVATLLNESILNDIVIEVDNYSGVPQGAVLNGGSYLENINVPLHANAFLNNFINRAWNSISNNNNTSVKVLVSGMLESDTTVIITTDGRHPITYRYPTFADSKFLPILMDNNSLELISEDYASLIDTALYSTTETMNAARMVNEGRNYQREPQQQYGDAEPVAFRL